MSLGQHSTFQQFVERLMSSLYPTPSAGQLQQCDAGPRGNLFAKTNNCLTFLCEMKREFVTFCFSDVLI